MVVQPVELGNLPAKWRSGIATEDEHHRPIAAKRRECHFGVAVARLQSEIRRYIARPKRTRARPHPHGFERREHHRRHGQFRHECREFPRRPGHLVVHRAGKTEPCPQDHKEDIPDNSQYPHVWYRLPATSEARNSKFRLAAAGRFCLPDFTDARPRSRRLVSPPPLRQPCPHHPAAPCSARSPKCGDWRDPRAPAACADACRHSPGFAHLFWTEPILLHHATGGVSAIGRQSPQPHAPACCG
jgi:hypothetical protein